MNRKKCRVRLNNQPDIVQVAHSKYSLAKRFLQFGCVIQKYKKYTKYILTFSEKRNQNDFPKDPIHTQINTQDSVGNH